MSFPAGAFGLVNRTGAANSGNCAEATNLDHRAILPAQSWGVTFWNPPH